MKRKILLSIIVACLPLLSFGQANVIKKLVAEADSIYKVYENTSNTKQKINLLCEVIDLQDSVYNMMSDTIKIMASFEKDAKTYRFFALTDESVFGNNYLKLDSVSLPLDLRTRYKAISLIKELSECLDGMEKKAEKAEKNPDIAQTDKKEYVAIVLKSDIERANKLFDQREKVNVDALSPKQKKFDENLSTRFNNILQKYIF